MSLLTSLVAPATQLLDKFIEDKDQKARLAHEISTMAERHHQEIVKGQLAINLADAKSGSFWQGGWRPSIGWCCSLVLFYSFILQPFAIFVIAIIGYPIPDLPNLSTTELFPILGSLLGIGSLRTFEKYKGVTK
tara:strand:+ start:2551 stop:2952 length:402 start_codon:yes stop_codon:yes gene_type:complete